MPEVQIELSNIFRFTYRRGAVLLLLGVASFVVSCNPLADLRDAAEGDLQPPELYGIDVTSADKLSMSFSEPVEVDPTAVFVQAAAGGSPIALSNATTDGGTVQLTISQAMQPGAEYRLESTVSDRHGNSVSFVTRFYGYNPDVPKLLINELTTRGAGNHPDVVELRMLGAGNLGGVTVYAGSPGDWDSRIVLPSVEVTASDFAIIHFRPAGSPDEVNETTDRTSSGGDDASDAAWDFWVPGGTGLSSNNGVVCVSETPAGKIMDAVVYSNRTSSSDTNYRGFGSRSTMTRVDEIVAAGAWRIAGSKAAPEDAVNPDDSTATRSMCRSSDSADTDRNSDWHIVPTSTSTFGAINSDEVYVP